MASGGGDMTVRPSVFDRLAGRVPRNVPGTQLTAGLRDLRRAVARDLEHLLNTTAWLPWDLSSSSELSSSMLSYGIPDVSSYSWLSPTDSATLCDALEEAIRQHEPRLEPRSVSVQLRDREDLADFRVRFRIDATLRVEPYVEKVSFDSEVDSDCGEFHVRGSA